jgi:hypothetical protein
MRKIRPAVLAVWEFIAGDDWLSAIGVVCTLGVIAVLSDSAISTWWVMPLAVCLLLVISLRKSMQR